MHARMKELDNQFITIVELLDGDRKEFRIENDFIVFMQAIFKENEEPTGTLSEPQTYSESLKYLKKYCNNLTLIQSAYFMSIKKKEQRHDLLTVMTMSKAGTFGKIKGAGGAYLNVTKGFNAPIAQIAIEATHTSGVGIFRKEREHKDAIINITFADRKVWSGTFENLQKALKVK